MMVRVLCICILFCFSCYALADNEYPPGQPEGLWEWIEPGRTSSKTKKFFRMPDKLGVCVFYLSIVDGWIAGTVKAECPKADSECASPQIKCHYQTGDRSSFLTSGFWVLKSKPSLFLSDLEKIYDQHRLKFSFAECEAGLCVFRDQNTKTYIPGWVSTGEKICRAETMQSNAYQQFQLVQPSFLYELWFCLKLGAAAVVLGVTGIIFYAVVIETVNSLTVVLPNYLYFILLKSAFAQISPKN